MDVLKKNSIILDIRLTRWNHKDVHLFLAKYVFNTYEKKQHENQGMPLQILNGFMALSARSNIFWCTL